MSSSFFVLADHLPLGTQIRLVRVKSGMRQVDVALLAGVTQAEVSALECGKGVRWSVEQRITRVFGLEVGRGVAGP